FTYPGRTGPALDHISFSIPRGGNVAVVGPSGAGKSTLGWLLLRFWEAGSGEILLSGRSICDYTQDLVRAQFAFASPHEHFFNTTIRENLRMARPGVSAEDMESAAALARIHETILRTPRGYDTVIGEGGMRLSAGERQRLAIARMLLKDAPILLLDEPTANLDPITEQEVLDTLFEAMKSHTSLLITHRLAGLEHVDQILVMNHGRIVERGTHASLLRQGGLYLRQWQLQHRLMAARYGFLP
ncbi:MAG TPA: ATP-binding cassette domain-containing protein, partial [Anaerolineales bacterium]